MIRRWNDWIAGLLPSIAQEFPMSTSAEVAFLRSHGTLLFILKATARKPERLAETSHRDM
jgi:hypothetical protein